MTGNEKDQTMNAAKRDPNITVSVPKSETEDGKKSNSSSELFGRKSLLRNAKRPAVIRRSLSRFKRPISCSEEYLSIDAREAVVKSVTITPEMIRRRQQRMTINAEQINVADKILPPIENNHNNNNQQQQQRQTAPNRDEVNDVRSTTAAASDRNQSSIDEVENRGNDLERSASLQSSKKSITSNRTQKSGESLTMNDIRRILTRPNKKQKLLNKKAATGGRSNRKRSQLQSAESCENETRRNRFPQVTFATCLGLTICAVICILLQKKFSSNSSA